MPRTESVNQDHPTLPDDPRDAAAYWFARVHSGHFTQAEQAQFQRWRTAHARHAQEYAALDDIWRATSLVPEDELRALMVSPASRSPARRRWMLAAGAAAVVGGVFGYPYVVGESGRVLSYVTAPGERRHVQLPDGSVIEMNVATQLAVRYGTQHRRVTLVSGEATFDVVGNPGQPFEVTAGDARVRVTGTVFNVRHEPAQVSVAVQSGAVEVSCGPWWSRKTALLAAGMAAWVDTGSVLRSALADVAAITAWRQGKIVFRNQPLEDVVREMNRYLAHPIHLADSRLTRLPMSGVFNIDDAEQFLQALQNHMPVVVIRRADGGVSLSRLH